MTTPSQTPVIAIIGGGFTGAAVAWNLAKRLGKTSARIVVHEPRETLGAGLAYDTDNPVHRINVPADRMSLDPAEPLDFQEWLQAAGATDRDPASRVSDGRVFPRRADFGAYVASNVAPYLASGRIEHVQSPVISVQRILSGWVLTRADGSTLAADKVVIATSHPAPAAPRSLAAILDGSPGFVPDATIDGALSGIGAQADVLIVGNGLTGADVAASLLAQGHEGRIISISRRGLRSRGHAVRPQEPHGDFTTRPSRSARLLTRRIREAIAQAELFGVSWHAVIDAVRSQGQTIWGHLSVEERRRIVRHLRPFWDVHRFRIAPQIEGAIEDAVARGQMESLAASVCAVSRHGEKIRVGLRLARQKGKRICDVDAVVVTTGPAHGGIMASQPFLQSLAAQGLAASDPTGLGLNCDASANLLDADGQSVHGLIVAGPLARGAVGELMGLPQVAQHAKDVALRLLSEISMDEVGSAENAA